MIPVFESKFGIKIIWNYFATSHGKGCVDGIGATTKMIVRKYIKARKCLVNSASDFVEAFNLTTSKIAVEETTQDEFDEINYSLGVAEIFNNAPSIRNIASNHQIQIVSGKIIAHEISKGYN